jgi:hypothetical protein
MVESHLDVHVSITATVAPECSYKDTSSASSRRAFATEALDFAIMLDLVVLQDSHLDFLALVLDLLGSLCKVKTDQKPL